MFTQAVRTASGFTYPYIGLRRSSDGEVSASVGAFIVVNSGGWLMTSGHIVSEILDRQKECDALSAGTVAPAERGTLCADHVEIWALPGFTESKPRVVEAMINPLADLALVRLESFDSQVVVAYPVLRDTTSCPVDQGMSVCRLGYPFHDIQAGYNSARREFDLAPNAFPVPSFALDGVVSRFHRITSDDGSQGATFIETSTPGLRGQSGGPLFDSEGRVCGVQSHTTHLDLGFDAHYSEGEQSIIERQFLNVGAATHVDDIRRILDDAGVAYATE